MFSSEPQFHAHGDYVHHHGEHHDHHDLTPLKRVDRVFGAVGIYTQLRPVVIGVVHGLAGSAAVALLIVSAIRSQLLATLYLAIFGAGTVVGMMLMTSALSAPIVYASRRFVPLQRYIAAGFSVASIGFGLLMTYEIGWLGMAG